MPPSAEIVGDAARHDAVHHQPMAETGMCRAQGALAQDAAFGIDQREGGVVADGADIAEMIGQALELGHQRAQPDGAPRHVDRQRRLDGLREGERIGDGAVAGGAAGELRAPARASRRPSAPSMPLCT